MSKILKICPYCGKQVPEGTAVCPVCKRSLTLPPPAERKQTPKEKPDQPEPEAAEPRTQPAEPERPQSPAQDRPRTKKAGLSKGAVAVLVISVVILVAAIVVLVTVLMGGGSNFFNGVASLAGNTPSPTFAAVQSQNTPAPTAEPTPAPTAEPTATPEAAPETAPTQETATSPDGTMISASNDIVWVKGNNVNVRSGPGTEYDSLGSVNAGTQLARTGTTENGWSRVSYDGQTAYIYSELLSTAEVSASSPTTAPAAADASGFIACSDSVTVKSDANLRTGPSTDDSVVAVAKAGTTLTRTGVSAKWSKISYDGQTCYVHNNLITATADSDGFAACNDTVTVKTDANLRTGPSTDDSVVTVLKAGTTLTRIGVSAKWSKISYNGQTCYIHNNMLG